MITLIQKQREKFNLVIWGISPPGTLKYKKGEDVKSFLTTCLIDHYEEDIRELENRKFQDCTPKLLGADMSPAEAYRQGTNAAISLAISLLQDKIKELKK